MPEAIMIFTQEHFMKISMKSKTICKMFLQGKNIPCHTRQYSCHTFFLAILFQNE
jgi:hypothetical protein